VVPLPALLLAMTLPERRRPGHVPTAAEHEPAALTTR
jgi:hypothetical protein